MRLSFVEYNSLQVFSTYFHVTSFSEKLEKIYAAVADFLMQESGHYPAVSKLFGRTKKCVVRFIYLDHREPHSPSSSTPTPTLIPEYFFLKDKHFIVTPCSVNQMRFWSPDCELRQYLEFYDIPIDKKKTTIYFSFYTP